MVANIDRLKEYRDFPLKLYDYIHIIDRYLTELSIIEELMDSMMFKNARR